MLTDHSEPALPAGNEGNMVFSMERLQKLVDDSIELTVSDPEASDSCARQAHELALSMVMFRQGDPVEISRLALQTMLRWERRRRG